MVWRSLQRSVRGSGQAAGATIVGSVPGVLVPFFLAARFSGNGLADAYLYAFGYATFMYALTYSPLEANVLPAAQSAIRLGRYAMWRFLLCGLRRAALIGLAAATFSVLLAAVLVPSSGPLSGSRGSEQLLILAVMGLYVMAGSVNGFLAACQYAFGKYNAPLLSIALRSVFPLVACLLVTKDFVGLVLVALGLGVGELCRTAWLFGSTVQIVLRLSVGDSARSGIVSEDELTYMHRSSANAMASLASGATPVVDRVFAARLPSGSVTVLELGEKVVQIPLTIVTSSVILLCGSKWSDRSSDRNRMSAMPMVNWLLGVATAAAFLLVVAIAVVGDWLMNVLGLPERSSLVGAASCLALSLPGAVLINVGARYLTASQRPGLLPAYSLLSLGLNIVGNSILGSFFGVVGIAFATLIGRSVLGVVNYFSIRRRERDRALGMRAMSTMTGTTG